MILRAGHSRLKVPPGFHAFCKLSATLGRDMTLVQGAGGNTSFKNSDILWIKASGTHLADAETSDIFLPIDLRAVRRRLAADEDDCAAGAVLSRDSRRASIETSIHAVMPHRVVAHVHCVETISWAILADGEREVGQRLDGISWKWIPYRRPGAPLARELVARVGDGAPPDVLVLQNHGLVVAGETCEEVESLLGRIRAKLQRPAHRRPIPPRNFPFQAPPGFCWIDEPSLISFAHDASALAAARGGVLYPDHAVFLGPVFLELQPGEDFDAAFARWRKALGASLTYLAIPDVGVLIAESAAPGALAMLQCLALVTARLAPEDTASGRVRYLSDEEVAALMNWDAEAYRQKLHSLGPSA